MKKLYYLLVFLFVSAGLLAQIAPDRFGYINTPEIIANKGFQLELGQDYNTLDYNTLFVRSATNICFRQGLSKIHEVRISLPELYAEDIYLDQKYGYMSVGVKIKVANYEKLKIASIGTFGIELQSFLDINRPNSYLQLNVPIEYKFTDKTSLLAEAFFNVEAYNYKLNEISNLSIGLKQRIGKNITLIPASVSRIQLTHRGDHGKKPEWNQVHYASFGLLGFIGENVRLDFGVMKPWLTGKGQDKPDVGLVFKAGLSVLMNHLPFDKNKVKISKEIH